MKLGSAMLILCAGMVMGVVGEITVYETAPFTRSMEDGQMITLFRPFRLEVTYYSCHNEKWLAMFIPFKSVNLITGYTVLHPPVLRGPRLYDPVRHLWNVCKDRPLNPAFLKRLKGQN